MKNKDLFLEKYCAYRLESVASLNAMVSARSAGCYRFGAVWQQEAKRGDFLELFWGMEGVVEFPGGRLLHENEAIFIMPGELHRQAVVCYPAKYCWLTLDGHPGAMIDFYRISGEVFSAGSCPEYLFKQLIGEVSHFTPAMRYAASATALKIVHMALGYSGNGGEHNLANEFFSAVEQNYASKNCTVEQLADQLGVSRVTLFRAVREAVCCTPKEYLDKCRLREAMKLLSSTHFAVSEVARRCGYSRANYFCKVFRKHTGQAPEQFRRNSH